MNNQKAEGLILYTNIFSVDESNQIYDYIDGLEYPKTKISRKTQHYGYEYDYGLSEPRTKKLKKIKPPPELLKCFAETFINTKLLENYPNQIIVNKYEPGEGIAPHRDHHPIFANDVGIISVGSGINMIFKSIKNKNDPEINIYLPVGSILIFKDEARYDYTHEIKKNKFDVVENKKIKRDTRISITFRHVTDKYRE